MARLFQSAHWLAGPAIAIGTILATACSGDEFAAAAGGASGNGGAGTSGNAGFPATQILDAFDRVDGEPGLSWVGSASYAIVEQRLGCTDCGTALLWASPFGADQEVFATLAGFDADAQELNLVLKAQSSSSCDLVEVIYAPVSQGVRIDFCVAGVWTELDSTALALVPGDRFGARSSADGTVEILANGRTVVALDASAFPYTSGRIGVDGISGVNGLYWDDFGGGDFKTP